MTNTSRARSEFRFAVGATQNERSTIWKIWTNKSDIYVTSRMMGSSAKVSLHESGACQFSNTSEWVKKQEASGRVVSNSDRHIVRWNIRFPNTREAKHIFRIIIPRSELRHISNTEKTRGVYWIETPPENYATQVELYLTPVVEELAGIEYLYKHLGSLKLSNSRWAVLFYQHVLMQPEHHRVIQDFRSNINSIAASNNIVIKPEYRAVGFSQDSSDLKMLIEIVPYLK